MTTYTFSKKIISIIEAKQTFVITTHVNPDGDALGSELALAEHLENLGKKVTILNSDLPSKGLYFIDPDQRAIIYKATKHQPILTEAEVIIVVDASGGWERVGRIGEDLEPLPSTKICIDHHPDPADFVDVAAVDTEAVATAELIYELIIAMEGQISLNMAQALYTAIITDSGNFRFPKTNPRTHHIAAVLLTIGVNPQAIYRQLYEQDSLNRVRLQGHLMESIQVKANGRLAHYILREETLKNYRVSIADLDGFASLAQTIKEVKVSIFCLEISVNRIKISLRSDGTIPINQIALEYGGGGHPAAAGATILDRDIDQLMDELINKVKQLLKDQDEAEK